MIYVLDTCSLIDLFKYYGNEENILTNIDLLIKEKRLVSVREVYNEIFKSNDVLSQWTKERKEIFHTPEVEELKFVSSIFEVNHFKMMIRKQQILRGQPVADPFLIAKTKVLNGCLITNEKYAKNGAKIPNVCQFFNIAYLNLDELIQKEDLNKNPFLDMNCSFCGSSQIYKQDENNLICNICDNILEEEHTYTEYT